MCHRLLKRPTISTLFQRPSEGVDKCNFKVTASGCIKLMALQAVDKCNFKVTASGCKKLTALQTIKGVTATTHPSKSAILDFQSFAERGPMTP
jgi:hypothetical protein